MSFLGALLIAGALCVIGVLVMGGLLLALVAGVCALLFGL